MSASPQQSIREVLSEWEGAKLDSRAIAKSVADRLTEQELTDLAVKYLMPIVRKMHNEAVRSSATLLGQGGTPALGMEVVRVAGQDWMLEDSNEAIIEEAIRQREGFGVALLGRAQKIRDYARGLPGAEVVTLSVLRRAVHDARKELEYARTMRDRLRPKTEAEQIAAAEAALREALERANTSRRVLAYLRDFWRDFSKRGPLSHRFVPQWRAVNEAVEEADEYEG